MDVNAFVDRKESWSERMKSIYESGGKRWSGLIEGQMKDEIASAAAENPARAIAKQWEGLVDSIISAIVALMESD